MSGAVNVEPGATLGGSGSILRSASVTGGVFAPGGMTLGRHLLVTNGVFRAVFGPGAATILTMAHPDARVLLQDTRLEITRLPGLGQGGVLTLIHNPGGNPVEGQFDGLPEGEKFSLGGGLFQITYQGGASGRDTVLTCFPAGTLLFLR